MKLANVFLLIIFLIPPVSVSYAKENILIEGKGFDNLIIGESKIQDVMNKFGEPDNTESPKEWNLNYIYSEIGLIINFHNGTLNTIRTLPNF